MRWEGGTASPWGQVVLLGRERKNDKLERGGGGVGQTGVHWGALGGVQGPPRSEARGSGDTRFGLGEMLNPSPLHGWGQERVKKRQLWGLGGGDWGEGGGGWADVGKMGSAPLPHH